jgi:hypothetical protein
MDQRRRHLHVADITCLHCAEKDSELERKADIIKALQLELNKSMEAEADALASAKAAGNALRTAKAQITRQAKEDADAEKVQALLDFWLESHPKAQCPPGGKRWEVCKKALVLMRDDEAGPVAACLEALEGLRLFPFMDMKTFQRHPENTGRNLKRKDDVEHALGDEVRIAKARSLSRWARGDLTDRCWQQYQWCQRAADYWMDLVMEGLGERRRRPIAEMAEKAMRENEGA